MAGEAAPELFTGNISIPPFPGSRPATGFFDLKTHYLVYVVNRGEHFRADPEGRKWVRYRAKKLYIIPRTLAPLLPARPE